MLHPIRRSGLHGSEWQLHFGDRKETLCITSRTMSKFRTLLKTCASPGVVQEDLCPTQPAHVKCCTGQSECDRDGASCQIIDPLCHAIGGTCVVPRLVFLGSYFSKECPLGSDSLHTGRCPPGKECCTATPSECTERNGNCGSVNEVKNSQHNYQSELSFVPMV